ncbi:hypothetical protein OsJ_32433 [Oryza sativa Japonica Group]|uniref:Peptidase metallopeptidase domain-containing protein n=1 Tax=Oryza sativa subsp. japonica TaxID=39947 RepID=B9G6Y7_ORYSJ|nr:hypothetical protein OsJ_32433 [Oryza sativa Japonica Group]
MFPRRRGDAACLLLLAIACILSCVAVADARPMPPPPTLRHHGGVVSRYAFWTGKPRWTRHGRPMVLTYAVSHTDAVGYLPGDAVLAVFRSAFARVGFYGAGEHGDGHPFDGPLNVYAHATGPEDGRIDFDAAERWAVDLAADASPAAVDLETVATHEIGHALGLDHSTSESSVMYPYVGTRERKVRLTVDDVEGIQELYGVNPSFSFLDYFKPDHDTPRSRFWRLGIACILLLPL